jgi:hypothetical protein
MLALQTNSSSVNACMHGSLLAATGQQPGLSVQHKISETLHQWQIATACPLENGRIRILQQPGSNPYPECCTNGQLQCSMAPSKWQIHA